ncbi:adhesion G protein-coupled receptor L3-like [Clavelina lepadiformis]|uniref:adhesion G protein-coupled receptor L3-like n=1 Tax=Clavelina lepadiformis TaxID=159417 RepID=UPI004042051C
MREYKIIKETGFYTFESMDTSNKRQKRNLISEPNKFNRNLVTALLVILLVSLGPCVSGNETLREETACDHDEITLTCLGNYRINVDVASYGREDDRTCVSRSNRLTNIQCSLPNAKKIVSDNCDNQSTCTFTVGQTTFSDPCPDTSKYLVVKWKCIPHIVVCPGTFESVCSPKRFETNLAENAAWVRDPFQQSSKIYYMGWSKYETSQLSEYNSEQTLKRNIVDDFHHLPHRVDGTGFVIYENSIYYNKESTRTVVRFDLGTGKVEKQEDLPNANYHGTSPYAVSMATDIDLAIDEHGLWAIYATEENKGNIVISRMNPKSLRIIDTWKTEYEKLSALNAFMVCGVLYVVSFESLQIEYMFNTTSKLSRKIRIDIPGLTETASSIQYNRRDQTLYAWDDQIAMSYKINFAIDTETANFPTTTTTNIATSSYQAEITSSSTPVVSSTTTTKPLLVTQGSPSSHFPVYCVGKTALGLQWPSKTYGQMAKLRCPGHGGSVRQAIWMCGGNETHPSWSTPEPDLTLCVSRWLRDLEEELNVAVKTPSLVCEQLLVKLRNKENAVTSWDVTVVVRLLRRLLSTLTVHSVLKCANELLSNDYADLWNGLAKSIQRETAIDFTSVVEDSAVLLAKDMVHDESVGLVDVHPTTSPLPSPNGNDLTWSEEFATLNIRVLSKLVDKKTTSTNVSPSPIRLDAGESASAIIDFQSVAEALSAEDEERIAIIQMSFRNLGNYIEDKFGIGSADYPVNSDVVSLMVKNLGKTVGQIKSRSHSVHLKQPVLLYVRHISNSYRNHVCAFWNEITGETDGKWWRSGCKRIFGNSTHSTCSCDHLTNFVVLSSNNPFPLLGTLESGQDSSNNRSNAFTKVNVARGGMVISTLALMVAFVLLLWYSNALDLNTIHKNIALSLILSEIVFLIGIHQTENPMLCRTVAAVLHYGVLGTFTWSSLESYHHLVVFADPQERNNRWKWYYVLGYGLPFVVVIISTAVDYFGYNNSSVCWLKTDGKFIWSFIAPACLAICLCVVFLTLVLCKLHRHTTRHTESDQIGIIRTNVARTCLLMFLLCAMWSCGFMWLSGYQSHLTVWFFAVLCAVHGITCFLFYCVFPPEVRSGLVCFKHHFKRNSSAAAVQQAHNSINSRVRLVPGNTRSDGTIFSNYHYAGHLESLTTLLPVSTAHRSSRVKPVLAIEDVEDAPLTSTSIAATSSHYMLSDTRGSQDPASCTASLCSGDNTNPKLPCPVHLLQQPYSSWNKYVHTSSQCPGHGTNSSTLSNARLTGCSTCNSAGQHHYEKPNSVCNCTISNSTRYDHLHEDVLNRHISKTKCWKLNSSENTLRSSHSTNPHHYETLGPFDNITESSNNECLCTQAYPSAMVYRHCYEDVEPHTVCIEHVDSIHEASELSEKHPANLPRSLNSGTARSNQSYQFRCCGMPLAGPSSGFVESTQYDCSRFSSRNGRSSDPLSTDQGYDTDSQQLAQIQRRLPHNDNDCLLRHHPSVSAARSCVHSDLDQQEKTISPGEMERSTVKRSYRNSSQFSTKHRNHESDCESENDLEVEFINSTTPSSHIDDALVKNAVQSNQNLHHCCNTTELNDSNQNLIDTTQSGRVSASKSVTSLSSVDPKYALPSCSAKETKVDSKEILAHDREQLDTRDSIVSAEFVSERKPYDSQQSNCYTLPGTAEAGTKARIDLRTGGISMITNL